MKLESAVVLVTGAGRGIGKAIALTLASQGSTLVLVARSTSELEADRAEIDSKGGTAHSIPTDLTADDEVDRLFNEIQNKHQRLDILVNNAGIGRFSMARDLLVSEFDAMWRW